MPLVLAGILLCIVVLRGRGQAVLSEQRKAELMSAVNANLLERVDNLHEKEKIWVHQQLKEIEGGMD